MTQQPRFQLLVLSPVLRRYRVRANLSLPLHMLAYMLQSPLQSCLTLELLLTEDTAAALRRLAHALIAARSRFVQGNFNGIDFAMRAAFLVVAGSAVNGCRYGRRMHASHMLDVEVFTIEVVRA